MRLTRSHIRYDNVRKTQDLGDTPDSLSNIFLDAIRSFYKRIPELAVVQT